MALKSFRRAGIACALVSVLLVALGGIALAGDEPGTDVTQDWNYNSTKPGFQAGDVVSTGFHGAVAADPHGGYSSASNYCMQCHAIHPESMDGLPTAPASSTGEYALMYQGSVTATCETCHGLFGNAGAQCSTCHTGGGLADRFRSDDFSGAVPATGSDRTAYVLTNTTTPAAASDHAIGSTDIIGQPDDKDDLFGTGWTYGAGVGSTDSTVAVPAGTSAEGQAGLYCGSCHTPHGEWGTLANSPKAKVYTAGPTHSDPYPDPSVAPVWANGVNVWYTPLPAGTPDAVFTGTSPLWKQLYLGGTVAGDGLRADVWYVCTDSNAPSATTCEIARKRDQEGNIVSLYGYKLLSASPNHSWGNKVSIGLDYRDHDQGIWCGKCHSVQQPSEYAGTYHNHPTGCTACHGNPPLSGPATAWDFPHTSPNGILLKAYPDALCIACHTGTGTKTLP